MLPGNSDDVNIRIKAVDEASGTIRDIDAEFGNLDKLLGELGERGSFVGDELGASFADFQEELKQIPSAADAAGDALHEVDQEMGDLADTADDAGEQVEGTSLKFTELRSKLELARWALNAVVGAFEDVYKAGRAGADLIGGDVAAAYDEFDDNLREAKEGLQEMAAEGLLPFIEVQNASVEAIRKLDAALEAGAITQQEYNAARQRGMRDGGAYIGMSEDTKKAIDDVAAAAEDASENLDAMNDEWMRYAEDSTSWDHALQVTAGIIESEVNAALETAEQRLGFVSDGFRELGITGPAAELALLNLQHAQGLLNDEQYESERLMLALGVAIKGGLIVDLGDLEAALLDGKLTQEEFAGLLGITEQAASDAGEEVEFLASQAERLDGNYHANITITVSGADLLAAAADDLAAMQDTHVGIDYSNPPPSYDAASQGGGRAHGGPVWSGQSYLVGEQGPEWFVPNQSGTIIPNGQTPGASMNFGDVTVIVPDAGDPEATARAVADYLGSLARQSASAGAQYTGM